jgi:hypothetical protein
MQGTNANPIRRPGFFAVGRSAADGMRLLVLRPTETPVRGPWDLHAVVRSAPVRPRPEG